jgi:hypothetical protein
MDVKNLDGWTRLWIVIAVVWMLFVSVWGAYEYHVGGLFPSLFFLEFVAQPPAETQPLNGPMLRFVPVDTIFHWGTFFSWLLIPVFLGAGLVMALKWINAGFKKQ